MFKYNLLINNIFGIIFYNFKDSNNITNVVTNIATSSAIYIFPNIVRIKNIVIKRVNVVTTKKNVITINRRAKVKRKNTRNFIKYILFNPITTIIINKFIDLFFLPFLFPDLIVQTMFLLSKIFFAVSALNIVVAVIVRFSVP